MIKILFSVSGFSVELQIQQKRKLVLENTVILNIMVCLKQTIKIQMGQHQKDILKS